MFDFRFESDTSFFLQKDENVDSSKKRKRKRSTSFSRIFILKHAWFHIIHVITEHLI